ncbi:hypothetical protein RHS02_00817, partial [Rhizoctonia solani]
MKFCSLPLEVLQIILRLVPQDNLASASLVCKTWRSIILPLLYRSICLYPKENKAENRWQDVLFNSSIHQQDGITSLTSYVNHLRVRLYMDEQKLSDFYSVASSMNNLKHLDWTVSILQGKWVDWYGTLVRLCQELPKLQSISLTMAQNEIPLGDLDEVNKSIKMVNMIVKLDVPIIKIVPLTNLRDLSITLDGLTGEDPDDELPSTLVEFIQGASNIESLSLAFEEDEERGAPPWGSIDLFSKLGSDCFPNLRILETKSLYLAPIDNYSGPEFRQFIRSSNKLQKIILSTDGYDSTPGLLYPPGLIVTPTDMEEMMPSIRHFGGPGLLVRELLKSTLTKQIQLLEFREPGVPELGSLGNVLQDLDNFVLDEMPNLRGLGYFNGYEEGDEWGAIANLLSRLATKLPALEELILVQFNWPEQNQLDRLLEAIQPLPRLRRLAISLWHSKISTREFVDNIQHFYERTGAPCPEVNVDIINPMLAYNELEVDGCRPEHVLTLGSALPIHPIGLGP